MCVCVLVCVCVGVSVCLCVCACVCVLFFTVFDHCSVSAFILWVFCLFLKMLAQELSVPNVGRDLIFDVGDEGVTEEGS